MAQKVSNCREHGLSVAVFRWWRRKRIRDRRMPDTEPQTQRKSVLIFTEIRIPEGDGVAPILYSLIARCKLCGIDPFVSLRDVLERINTHPAGRIDELTPPVWLRRGLRLRQTGKKLSTL